MIIDFHCHIGVPGKGLSLRQSKEITATDIRAVQEKTGINASVILPMPQVYPADLTDANERIMTETSVHMFPFVWLNPYFISSHDLRGTPAHTIVEILKQRKVYGIKVHPVFDGYYPEPRCMESIFEIARECNLPILWHTGWGAFGDPLFVELSAKLHPHVTIVIGHMAEAASPFVVARCDNVYMETSYCSGPQRLAGVVKLIGSEKILFGSDFPANSPIVQKTIIEEADISDVDKENIFSANARRLLKII